jgi:hypothetical protein
MRLFAFNVFQKWKIEIQLPKLRQVSVIIDETMLPDEMEDSSASIWKNETVFQQKIQEMLFPSVMTTISRRVPQHRITSSTDGLSVNCST